MEFILFIVGSFIIILIYLMFDKEKMDEIISIINMAHENQSNNTKSFQKDDYTVVRKSNRNMSNSSAFKFAEKGTKGHTARVWRKKGYKIKAGETYSYKYYGNEVYTKNQVEKLSKLETKKKFNDSNDYNDRKADYEDKIWQKGLNEKFWGLKSA